MDSLQQMYQQVILDHAKKPHGRVAQLASVGTVPSSMKPSSTLPSSTVPSSTVPGGAPASSIITSAQTDADHCATSHQVNPTCGDEITLELRVNDGKIADLQWLGQGCSISQASASVMTDLVKGQKVADALAVEELFHELMNSRGKGLSEDAEDELGDAVAFTGTSQYPARIKCALLGWMALKDAISSTAIGKAE